jgi:hypothetical protein
MPMIYLMWTFSAEIATFFGPVDGDAGRILVKTEQMSPIWVKFVSDCCAGACWALN